MLDKILDGIFGKGQNASADDPFSSIMGTLGSGMLSGATSAMTSNAFGTDAASQSKDVADKLYPGISPWERLHAGGGGVTSAGGAESIAQKALTGQLNTAKRHTDMLRENVRETNKSNVLQTLIGAATVGGPLGLKGNILGVGNMEGIQKALKDMGIEVSLGPDANLEDSNGKPGVEDWVKDAALRKKMGIPF